MNKFPLVLAGLLAGCQITPPPIVHQPMSVRPPLSPSSAQSNGAIYQVSNSYRPMFEDRRARYVGDTLVVNIVEKTQANKKSGTNVDKSNAMQYGVTSLQGLPGKSFLNSSLNANSSTKFDGSGQSTANNDFAGTITATVIDVYPNGNLLVSGEKQIAMSQGTEFIRFSGVVDPRFISTLNTVISTQVADARIEYRANGIIDEAQILGWLARFFLTFLPF